MPNVWVEAENFETEVPEPLREYYEQQSDGRWKYGDAEDVSALKRAQERVKDERNKIRDELKELRARVGGIDLEQAAKLLKEAETAQVKKAADDGDIEKAVEIRIKAMREQHGNEKSELTAERDALRAQLDKAVLESGISTAAAAAGVRPEAVGFVIDRARARFRNESGQYVAYGDDGEPVYEADGSTRQGFESFVKSLKKDAPFLFSASTGGGAPSTSRSAAGGAPADMTNVRGLAKMRLARQS